LGLPFLSCFLKLSAVFGQPPEAGRDAETMEKKKKQSLTSRRFEKGRVEGVSAPRKLNTSGRVKVLAG